MYNIHIENLTKIYNRGQENEVRALDGINFDLEEGSFVVILGASGAGKSTLLNIMGGMDSATEGTYRIQEEEVTDYNEKKLVFFRRKNIGFVFQFYNLMPNLTALENIELAAAIADDPLDSREVLKQVGLENRANNFPSQLSGGEQQRVAIARAVVKNPSLLLCDEPTGALDTKTVCQILSMLHEISHKYHKNVVVVTHNSKIALCAKRVITIADGKIISDIQNEDPLLPEEVQW